ncbi:MAG: endonuclease III [Bacteroidota bacterium]
MARVKTRAKRQNSKRRLKSQAKKIITRLRKRFPDPKVELNFDNPLELLVATILSAQCTDARVNLVTRDLFRKYRTASDYARASTAEFEEEIRPTGFFRSKAKSIINCCKSIIDEHEGRIPDRMEELVQLPGIGRKTANVILGQAFNTASGIVVDTHVQRVSQRLGLTKHSDPEKIEQELLTLVPRKDWIDFGTMMVLHGRYVCLARKPKCPDCLVVGICPSAEIFMREISLHPPQQRGSKP